uniref:Uncharacterized protein n=1 Tax=Anguilla anguilla TaxID=7936 RepID=A0A0E9QS85_ANGAN
MTLPTHKRQMKQYPKLTKIERSFIDLIY